MAINVRFMNLSHANHEILKTFNSSTAEKALEAYQPLTEKERKLRKLRALQILKQSSGSNSLGEISLDNSSLSLALKNAEGATLQAMLNLLSAKMIEQNKILINKKSQELKAKQEEERKARLEAEQKAWEESQKELLNNEDEREPEAKKSTVEEIIKQIVNEFENLKKATLKAYQDTLDFFTLRRLKQFYDAGIEMLKDFLYRQPREYFEQEVIQPIRDLPSKIQTFFSDKDLKFILKKPVLSKDSKSEPLEPLASKTPVKKFLTKQEAIASLHQ